MKRPGELKRLVVSKSSENPSAKTGVKNSNRSNNKRTEKTGTSIISFYVDFDLYI